MTWFEWTSLVCVSAPAKAGVTVGEDGAIEDGCGGQVLDGSDETSRALPPAHQRLIWLRSQRICAVTSTRRRNGVRPSVYCLLLPGSTFNCPSTTHRTPASKPPFSKTGRAVLSGGLRSNRYPSPKNIIKPPPAEMFVSPHVALDGRHEGRARRKTCPGACG